jgi:hypothetical protein
LDLSLVYSKITDSIFLRVTDYSDHNAQEQRELWDGLVGKLREQVGG